MNICLISPPTVIEFSERKVEACEALRLIASHAPMGILSLAAVLEQHKLEPQIVDLNSLYYEYVSRESSGKTGQDFCSFAADALSRIKADVFGFSTICSTYPFTLRFAERIRKDHPRSFIVLGGPQASVVDVPTLQHFPFIDLIVRGEAEVTLIELLEAISRNSSFEQLPGLSYRKGPQIVRNPNAPVIEDLDGLPLPAFHLYPHLRDCDYAPIEAGRGCPFACSFCSTNDFFRRRFRMKSPDVLVKQMIAIKNQYDISNFEMIHDMFTVDRRKVVSFCDAVGSCGEQLSWSCSARTDCIDDELISLMAGAGCNGIFFGIDTGSDRMQAIIHKRLNLDDADSRIRYTNRKKIDTTVSLITAYPEETKEDLRGTIHFLGESLRCQHSQIQLHLLAPLAETPITTQYQDQLVYDDIFSDISFQGWEQDPEDRALIVAHRDIFTNFYGVPTLLDREYLRELREFILRGTLTHRWLMVLLHHDAGDLLSVFERWQAWSSRERSKGGHVDTTRSYYTSEVFSEDLFRFIWSAQYPTRSPHLLRTMVTVENHRLRFGSEFISLPDKRRRNELSFINTEAVPILASGARVITVDADYKRLMKCLKRRERIDQIPAKKVALVFLKDDEQIKIIQLNDLTYQLMRLCDGSHSIEQIATEFSAVGPSGVSPMKATMYALTLLAGKGLIETQLAA
ncbi:MAG TPA: radical SAM protein [Pyrinomonadaceae bacterium]|nr:radical SAM protein [Pyrinomonadaceae bacterium]